MRFSPEKEDPDNAGLEHARYFKLLDAKLDFAHCQRKIPKEPFLSPLKPNFHGLRMLTCGLWPVLWLLGKWVALKSNGNLVNPFSGCS
jgi:hypothetical protein